MEQIRTFSYLFLLVLTFSCGKSSGKNTLFQLLPSNRTGVDFINRITTSDSVNLLTYEYLYNGGGVGVGHFNKDSLPDLIFTSNMEESKIYLNKGNLQFEDITLKSNINTNNNWCTGVSVIDINGDGLDDIYISVGGMGNKDSYPNLLYINQGDSTFVESAKEYGLDDKGESIQSIFFDYDRDGDLDMYLLTGGGFENSAIMVRPMVTNGTYRNTDRLYRNDFNESIGHPVYTNVSREAGINFEGFGLGVSVIDANNDTWPDIYVSNDYLSRDLLYVNNKDGSFSEEALTYFGHTSHFSMGNDVADINNDGLMDVITLDMLPEQRKRRKLMSGSHSYDMFQMAKKFGYGHQYMRNMLHYNNGNGTFSEIGQLVGIDRTDWSWAPLISDFNNDGNNDIFITNGYGKDITDLDFVKFRQSGAGTFSDPEDIRKSVLDCLVVRPTIALSNYIFANKGQLKFQKRANEWGLQQKSISNGACYTDLDLDGDLELVVNNIDQPAFIYKNNTRELGENSNYIQISLVGDKFNPQAIGAEVTLYHGSDIQKKVLQSVRGFQSSVEKELHFGLGATSQIDSIEIIWPNGKTSTQTNVLPNQRLKVNYSDVNTIEKRKYENGQPIFQIDSLVDFKHEERVFNDFNVQSLLNHGFSNLGPGLAVGDINADDLQDIFVGGSYGFASTIFVQQQSGGFEKIEIPDSELYEDLGALFFDANGDGLQDLYVVSGGSERYTGHQGYQDRLYLNNPDKVGTFAEGVLPTMHESTSTVVGGDFDGDGDIDLFVGGRVVPGRYPESPASYVLENRNGQFVDVTQEVAPSIENIGMVSSAVWTDYNNDSHLDLVLVGEFMPITVFKGNGIKLKNITDQTSLAETNGLWNSIVAEDFDNDGDIDFVVGNIGLNSPLKGTAEHPLRLDYADFDENGFIDPIFSVYEEGGYHPMTSLDELTAQLPHLKKQILHYRTYAKSTTKDILEILGSKQYATLESKVMSSSIIQNNGKNGFSVYPLSLETQFAPVYGILAEDLNFDGLLDLVLVGNSFDTEVVYGRYDASIGTVLLNKGGTSFEGIDPAISGFKAFGDSKSMVRLDISNGQSLVLVGKNNGSMDNFIIAESEKQKKIDFQNGESTAKVFFNNGKKRKEENLMGTGYLSQTSNSIIVSSVVDSIQFFDVTKKLVRTEIPNKN
ncbi:VCBS repeat-containing protein [[Muricauda] lutisoli]|uniref:VCBS repeat-containing protein n=1 Tax=[Muricauda] lutisoli TaxID=2816035 RepID=A0ABS3ESG1_9FLAO|nr:VCBS repeat-containing protein [[Muricauda] lutisoli]MBO0329072.1 VCBS repeat-containing protein [[Muricauda] lutisoli]